MSRRTRIHMGVGDILETGGAGLACYAVYRLAGLSWALVLAAIVLVAAAELVYDQHRVSFDVPQPVRGARRLAYRARKRFSR